LEDFEVDMGDETASPVMDKAKKVFNMPKPKVRTYTSLNPGVTTPRRNIMTPISQ